MMNCSMPTLSCLFFFIFFLSIPSFAISFPTGNNTVFCPEIEKQSLLSLKNSLKDPYKLLSSWDAEVNCCKWNRVICSNLTGHVHQLHLQGNYLSGKINPSLLNLKHLTYLNLSDNSFDGETIPSFMGSLSNLEHLDLSDARFEGKIPHTIGNLSNLHTLHLGNSYGLEVDSLEWLSGLSKLECLNMEFTDLSRATDWAQVINSLPSLLELHLSFCSLDFSHHPNTANLSTSLTFLDLSWNGVHTNQPATIPVPVPVWCFHLRNLLFLDLSFNYHAFGGPIPTTSNATKIQHVDLSFNDFSNSSIPDWLYECTNLEFISLSSNSLQGKISSAIANLTSLKTLNLGYNQLSGKIPREITSLCKMQTLELSDNELERGQDIFRNMSGCFLESLEKLSLSRNQLSGHLIEQFGEFKSLEYLDLSYNSLSGSIPISLGNLSSLKELYLYDNKFTGNIPECLGQHNNLAALYIGNNNLEGIVTEIHFANLSKLMAFHASGNRLTLNVGTSWVPPIQLKVLAIGSWSLGVDSEMPSWLQTQRNITQLDLSNTGISGSTPRWFFDTQYLNVSHNNLHGKITHVIGSQFVFMSYNKLSGSLPPIGATVRELDLSHNLFSGGIFNVLCNTKNKGHYLQFLLLEGNQLSGELPDCWNKFPVLTHLKLGNNTMSGSIPNSIGFLAQLESLSLHSNKFSGQIPLRMQNCTNLRKIDLSHNNLDGKFPTWIGTSLVNMEILILRSNKLSGEISSEICHLQSLNILDLSNNKFSGMIPRCVSNFSAMAIKRRLGVDDYSVGLSDEAYSDHEFSLEIFLESASIMTKGVELEYSTILSLVTNLDLSMNNLSGDIPKELTSLVELRSLNLSGNHLTGSIPESIGDMKQLESLDLSNNSLSNQIPNGLTLISSLSHLNLSFNKLTGRIPQGTQLGTLEASSFIGNDLCGPPLTRNCSGDSDEVHAKKEENEGEKSEIEWLFVFISLGFAVGFSAVCTALVLNKSWRYAYFRLLECMWDNLYVYFYIKWKRLTTSPT
ncbi:hypothetical protein C2S53_012600 [Perilla frutescens var. hirtella]|uniref:Leucine-rich repeat-containing N-terminal plant-type domain-containing protein n=1 Tax=Perilla frutescens var. hirtella TaxID=608512 RepID=A0AAD4IMH5_PERFH|nr:hypothetical protein C2S53_012600 [Perilla frutescens var. hirtella]